MPTPENQQIEPSKLPNHPASYGLGFVLGAALGGIRSYFTSNPKGKKLWSDASAEIHHKKPGTSTIAVLSEEQQIEEDITVSVYIIKGWIKRIRNKINRTEPKLVIKTKAPPKKQKRHFKQK